MLMSIIGLLLVFQCNGLCWAFDGLLKWLISDKLFIIQNYKFRKERGVHVIIIVESMITRSDQ